MYLNRLTLYYVINTYIHIVTFLFVGLTHNDQINWVTRHRFMGLKTFDMRGLPHQVRNMYSFIGV